MCLEYPMILALFGIILGCCIALINYYKFGLASVAVLAGLGCVDLIIEYLAVE